MTIFAEKNKIGRTENLILQLVALPVICIMLVSVVAVVGIIATEPEERSDIMIKKEDVAILLPGADVSEYSVECSTLGNFILAMDEIFITDHNEGDLDKCNMVIYRSNNERVINRLLREVNQEQLAYLKKTILNLNYSRINSSTC